MGLIYYNYIIQIFLQHFENDPNKRVIGYKCGNNYIISVEEVLFKPSGNFFDFDGDFLTIKEVYKGQDVTAPYVYRLGYTHSGWDKELTNVQNNMIVYAQYTPIVYNVYYYNLFDGVAPETNPTSYTIEDYFVLQEPTRFGYTFTGWQNGWGGSIISYLYGDVGTKYLYATWEINSHNINYNIDDYDDGYEINLLYKINSKILRYLN